jgi:hypothetical protein
MGEEALQNLIAYKMKYKVADLNVFFFDNTAFENSWTKQQWRRETRLRIE